MNKYCNRPFQAVFYSPVSLPTLVTATVFGLAFSYSPYDRTVFFFLLHLYWAWPSYERGVYDL